MIWAVPLHLVDHPLVQDALMELRDKRTRRRRSAARPIASACCWRPRRSATCRRLPRTVTTPLGPADGRVVRGDVVVVPVLRAGLGMLDAVLELLPAARVGHIGLQRDEATAIASKYYSKLPPNLRRQLRADDRPDAGDRRQRRRRDRSDQGRRRADHPHDLHRRGARGRRAGRAPSPRRPGLHARRRPRSRTRTSTSCPGLGDFGDRLYGTV